MKASFPHYPLFLLLLLCSACGNNEIEKQAEACEKANQLGDIKCLPASLLFIPYAQANTIPFKDSLGQVHEGSVISYSTKPYSAQSFVTYPCAEDPSFYNPFFWRPEIKAIDIQFASLDVELFIALEPVMDPDEYALKRPADICTWWLYSPIGSKAPNAILSMIVDPRQNLAYQGMQSPKLDELILQQDTFSQVYYNTPSADSVFQLYYNAQHGVVGFSNAKKKISLRAAL